jgi:hypothetical protein
MAEIKMMLYLVRFIWTINKNPEARFVQNATIDLNIAVKKTN